MSENISVTEAQLALDSVDRRRQQVVAEINVPAWYWCGLAAGWVALGVLAQFGPAWAIAVGTLLFGAAHASIGPRVLTGRRGSHDLSVKSDLVSLRIPLAIIGFLIAMSLVTVGLALLLNADGTRHAAIFASAVVAALVLCGGPALMASLRRHAQRRAG